MGSTFVWLVVKSVELNLRNFSLGNRLIDVKQCEDSQRMDVYTPGNKVYSICPIGDAKFYCICPIGDAKFS